jgi:hypothetical protein
VELDLPVEKGYALVTDINPLFIGAIIGAVFGGMFYTIQWAMTTGCDVSKWNWRDFAISIALGAVSGVHGSARAFVTAGASMMRWLPFLPPLKFP